ALGETGKPCTGPACRGVEAATIIAHFDGQLSPLAHDGHSDACGAAVLQHVGQAFLQESQQVEAACGPESTAIEILESPAADDAVTFQSLVPAVPQWRQQ